MSINKLLLFSLLFNLFYAVENVLTPPDIYDALKCGEEDNPEDEKDCTKYGTGSGMVCCYISPLNKKDGKCRLVPDNLARERNIKGSQTFPTYTQTNAQYWDCGNNSNYIHQELFYILLLMFLL